ncbi:hypothetical protein JQC91_16995 [Jannaschia sp. Os4]|uniref:hypothetical protein n=1 Tax=Jannaschia sp. Os4 TaxID=2807617 RepID=UPI0019393DE8|nr:hypothetical protein [Jannaschia sp. Os4]MBM2578005.1 hypothetical protein [Jannaschia sp. Os4]
MAVTPPDAPRWSAPRRPEDAPDLPYVDHWFHARAARTAAAPAWRKHVEPPAADVPRALSDAVEQVLRDTDEAAS